MAFGRLSVKGRALRLLAQREHSRAELERKLARHVDDTPVETAQQQIARALDELVASGLLSDARAAESVLRFQGARFGSRRLKQTLQARGLAADLVGHTLQQARVTEVDRARQVWQRKFGVAPADAAAAGRQMRFLAGRGFDGEVIRQVLRGARGSAAEAVESVETSDD